jgi:hypothetical protein
MRRAREDPLSPAGLLSSGGGIRTRDLRVMSPTSYLTAQPRVEATIIERDAGEFEVFGPVFAAFLAPAPTEAVGCRHHGAKVRGISG